MIRTVHTKVSPRAWKVVVIGLAALLNYFALAFLYTYTVFLGPVGEEFSVSRTVVSLPSMVFWGALATAAPFIGALLDRIELRRAMLIGTGVFGLAFCMLAFAPIFWMFVGSALVLGFSALFVGTQAVNRLIVNWFDRSRGLAFGIASTGYGLSGMTLPLLSTVGIEFWGWRTNYLAFGLLIFVVLLPLVFFLIYGRPRDAGIQAEGFGEAQQSGTAHAHGGGGVTSGARSWSVIASADFWRVSLIIGIPGAIMVSIFTHAAPVMHDQSITAVRAAAIVSVIHLGVLAGNAGWGWLADRMKLKRVIFLALAVQMTGLAGFTFSREWLWFGVTAFVSGVGSGAVGPLHGFIVSRVFDSRTFGYIFGATLLAVLPIHSAALFLPGWFRDVTGTYVAGLVALLLGYVITGVLASTWPRLSTEASPGRSMSPQHEEDAVVPSKSEP